MRKIFLILSTFVFVLTLTGCAKAEYINIDNEELAAFLENKDNYQFVDVRTSTEYYKERIPGFTYNIDYYLLDKDHTNLDGLDKTIPVVIICNSGNRSVSAAEIFIEEGFETVYNIEDGISNWNGETE